MITLNDFSGDNQEGDLLMLSTIHGLIFQVVIDFY